MKEKAYKVVDVPSYDFDPNAEKPWRDEDLGMSAPRTLAKDLEFAAACDVASDHMTNIATMNHVQMGGEQGMYLLAAAFFGAAKMRRFPADLSIQVSGRVLRVVEQS